MSVPRGHTLIVRFPFVFSIPPLAPKSPATSSLGTPPPAPLGASLFLSPPQLAQLGVGAFASAIVVATATRSKSSPQVGVASPTILFLAMSPRTAQIDPILCVLFKFPRNINSTHLIVIGHNFKVHVSR